MTAHVRPGDVIGADLWNAVLDKLDQLEQRISAVEDGIVSAGAIINSFQPELQQEVGRVLTIKGKFDFPPNLNSVTIDGVAVTQFLAFSNESQLLVTIPPSILIPPGTGRNVAIVVRNSRGEDPKSYRLLARVPVTTPAPSISSVVNQQDNSPLLQTGKSALITGANFATPSSGNTVEIRLMIAGTTVVYPKPGDSPIAVDPLQSSATQLVITIPTITEIAVGPTHAAGGALFITVGANEPVGKDVAIQRLA